jgi:hypothetical protein
MARKRKAGVLGYEALFEQPTTEETLELMRDPEVRRVPDQDDHGANTARWRSTRCTGHRKHVAGQRQR